MALDKAIDSAQLDADLTAVADAIRNKGGTSEALAFPGGFVDAVGAIEAGGGDLSFEDIATNNLEKNVVLTCEGVSDYAFSYKNIAGVSSDTVKSIGGRGFTNCKKLTYARFPACTWVGPYAFSITPLLMETDFSACEAVSGYSFREMSCEELRLPSINTKSTSGTFQYSYNLRLLDLGQNFLGFSGANDCQDNHSMTAVVLRSGNVCVLSNVGVFKNTPMTGYGGAYSGHIYVPSALIAEYQSATNWATLYANYPDIFAPIEGSEYE